MLTPFGKELRKLRIDQNKTLKDMADYVGVTSAFLSSVETGRKRATDDLIIKASEFLNVDTSVQRALKDAAWRSANEYKFDVTNVKESTRETVAMFARNFSDLPDEKIRLIKELLGGN